jgi:hypothetical protein
MLMRRFRSCPLNAFWQASRVATKALTAVSKRSRQTNVVTPTLRVTGGSELVFGVGISCARSSGGQPWHQVRHRDFGERAGSGGR